MKKTIRYSKDARLHIRVDKKDLTAWKKKAAFVEITLTEFVIICLNMVHDNDDWLKIYDDWLKAYNGRKQSGKPETLRLTPQQRRRLTDQ